MVKALGIIKELQSGVNKGAPDVAGAYSGFVYVGPLVANYAIYVITATGPQLTAIQAEANCIAGVLITDAGVRWPEMSQPVPAGIRTKINTWRAANSLAPIGTGVTLLQVAKFARANFTGDGATYDVFDAN